MLGRQQIANASTAISELFKNAYDAYAKHVEIDHFRSDGLLVIRDDGYGMTKKDFENRWLVLGTESKVQNASKNLVSYCPPGEVRRPTMGEKGIGRLAIALLGPQTLVLTRAVRDGQAHDLLLSYLHWGLFECPEVNLEDIDIPVMTIQGGRLPTPAEVGEVKLQFAKNVRSLKARGAPIPSDAILTEIERFQPDPSDILNAIGGLTLADNASGTHFYIAPANPTIAAEIDAERRSDSKEFSKFLLGFSNELFAEQPPPPIKNAFRDWRSDDDHENLLAGGEFFTREELDSADHFVSGTVDEFGQFRGRVRIYEKEYADHVIPWRDAGGRPTDCGPFKLEFGYLQGALRESRMDPEAWARLNSKLEKIGGLYVYRDRIRVLPYGNSDVDWVDIELRRNKGAGYYFFSYRRSFGAVCLTRDHNSGLVEKAGREGFQQNQAYRQLKAILESIFIQLAADFFREKSESAKPYWERKKELERLAYARRRREQFAASRKREFATKLETFFQQTATGMPEAQVGEMRRQVVRRMEAAARLPSPDQASAALLSVEREALAKLAEIRDSYRVPKPRGIGLSRSLTRDWEAYEEAMERLENEVFGPASREIAETLGRIAVEASVLLDQRKRVQELLEQFADTSKQSVQDREKEVRESVEKTSRVALRTASDSVAEMRKVIAEVEADFQREDLSGLPAQEIESVRHKLELRINEVGRKNAETLARIRDLLTGVADSLSESDGGVQLDAMEALETELEGLREQSDADVELVQLGLAIAVINHEFEASIKGVRQSLRSLRPWAKANSELAPVYQAIRNTFDHLDGHLSLFTPLQRRLYREPIGIKGVEINHYVSALFEARLKRHGIQLTATNEFLLSEKPGYPSTLYPVFVNVIDNAIFWLRGEQHSTKQIELDARDGGYMISNTGPMISERDRESIFEQRFTRKPGGRGLGLFISRKVLRREGMDIVVGTPKAPFNAAFFIKWKETCDASEDRE
jgi:signal transduction histidine kinase